LFKASERHDVILYSLPLQGELEGSVSKPSRGEPIAASI
jgi:hypothetical protein